MSWSKLWKLIEVNQCMQKNAVYLSVNVFSTKVLIGDSIFYISYWRRDHLSTWSSKPRKSLPACSAKGIPSFLSSFKILSIGPALGIEPVTSRSAVKRSTNWANPAATLHFLFLYIS